MNYRPRSIRTFWLYKSRIYNPNLGLLEGGFLRESFVMKESMILSDLISFNCETLTSKIAKSEITLEAMFKSIPPSELFDLRIFILRDKLKHLPKSKGISSSASGDFCPTTWLLYLCGTNDMIAFWMSLISDKSSFVVSFSNFLFPISRASCNFFSNSIHVLTLFSFWDTMMVTGDWVEHSDEFFLRNANGFLVTIVLRLSSNEVENSMSEESVEIELLSSKRRLKLNWAKKLVKTVF